MVGLQIDLPDGEMDEWDRKEELNIGFDWKYDLKFIFYF